MSTPLEVTELHYSEHESASRSVHADWRLDWDAGQGLGYTIVTVHVGAERRQGRWLPPSASLSLAGGPGLTLAQLDALVAFTRKLFVAYAQRYEGRSLCP